MEFVSIVKSMIRDDERAWFLCSEDYDMQGDKAWQWNEWELLSLEAAENDAAWKDEIRKFWDGHLPVFLSLEGGYAYYAISIKEGSIVYGSEPELSRCISSGDTSKKRSVCEQFASANVISFSLMLRTLIRAKIRERKTCNKL